MSNTNTPAIPDTKDATELLAFAKAHVFRNWGFPDGFVMEAGGGDGGDGGTGGGEAGTGSDDSGNGPADPSKTTEAPEGVTPESTPVTPIVPDPTDPPNPTDPPADPPKEPTKVEELPEWAQKEIKEVREESKGRRLTIEGLETDNSALSEKVTTHESQWAELATLMGITVEEGKAVDPSSLIELVKTENAAKTTEKITGAVTKALETAEATVLDDTAYQLLVSAGSLDALDPASKTFQKDVDKLVADLIEKKPFLKTTPHATGPSGRRIGGSSPKNNKPATSLLDAVNQHYGQ